MDFLSFSVVMTSVIGQIQKIASRALCMKKNHRKSYQRQVRFEAQSPKSKDNPNFKDLPNLSAIETQLKIAYRIADTFPEQVYAKAAQLTELTPAQKAGLEDLRGQIFVTIDGEDARDFDDAIAVEHNAQVFHLWVAIADVSRYVPKTRQNSKLSLDSAAQARGNSFYFPMSVAPMLPPRLSTDLASLKQHTERPVVVCELWLTQTGEVVRTRFYEALIASEARLTYTEVQGLLLTGDPTIQRRFLALPKASEILRMLDSALRLSELLRTKRRLRGSLLLQSSEPAYSVDARGQIQDIGLRRQNQAHHLIEECMILANEACAEYLSQKGLPLLYRTHAKPAEDQLWQLQKTLSHCPGFLLKDIGQKALQPEDLQSILKVCKGTAWEQAVNALCLRALPKALYSTENIGHFGLASSCYCHFTSPIRRYADLLVHRTLKHSLGCDELLLAHKRLEIVASHLNRQEERALRCQREMHKYCSVLYLRQHLGEDFHAFVSNVTQSGFFVELVDRPVSGFVPKRLLPSCLRVDMDKQGFFNTRTGECHYQFGDRILVRLISVLPQRLASNFLPLSSSPQKQGRASKRRTFQRQGGGD